MSTIPISTSLQADWQAARAAARSGDLTGERAALSRILERDRRDVMALLAMGESYAKEADNRAATSWFTAALNQSGLITRTPALQLLLERAARFCSDAAASFAAHLDSVTDSAVFRRDSSAALRHAVELLHGRSEVFLQHPTMFYYPGLPQRAFYERDEFDWVADIEAQAESLRDEYLALLGVDEPFEPYVQNNGTRPPSSSSLLGDPGWGAAYLWQQGEPTALSARCPATMAAMALAPQPNIIGRSPMALYSRLRPGTHIEPHHGLLNTRLICHLPLVAPDGCALRVGAETREWRFGEMLIFDDSVEHEAWNRGNADRTILLFEIWRPEIPEGDRALLDGLFRAIDAADPARGQERA